MDRIQDTGKIGIKLLLMAQQLCKLPGLGKGSGATGLATAVSSTHIPTCNISHHVKEQSSSLALPQGYRLGLSEKKIKSVFKWSRMCLRPSPRPAKWLDNQVPYTIYEAEGEYILPIKCLVEGFKCAHPPSIPQMAVTVQVPEAVVKPC